MYLLIEGSRIGNFSPIVMSIIGEYKTLEEASKKLKTICYYYEDKDFMNDLIQQHINLYDHDDGNFKSLKYTNNLLTYFSIDNLLINDKTEVRTYEIFKVGE